MALAEPAEPASELVALFHGTSVSAADEIRSLGICATAARPLPLADTHELAIDDSKGAAAAAHLQGLGERGLLVLVEIDAALLEPDVCRPDPCAGRYLIRDTIPPAAVAALEVLDFGWGWISPGRASALAHHLARESARRDGVWTPVTPFEAAFLIDELKDLAAMRERKRDRLDQQLAEIRQKRAEAAAKMAAVRAGLGHE